MHGGVWDGDGGDSGIKGLRRGYKEASEEAREEKQQAKGMNKKMSHEWRNRCVRS